MTKAFVTVSEKIGWEIRFILSVLEVTSKIISKVTALLVSGLLSIETILGVIHSQKGTSCLLFLFSSYFRLYAMAVLPLLDPAMAVLYPFYCFRRLYGWKRR
jgi:hypothetical protein